MKQKMIALTLALVLLLAATPALAAGQEIRPDPSTLEAEGQVPIDMTLDEGYVVLIPGDITIAPGVGGRDYAVGDVGLTEAHLLPGRQVRLGLPQRIQLDSAVKAGNTVEAGPFIGAVGGAKQSEAPLSLEKPTPVGVTFAPHAFADAVAGSYRGTMIYKVWIAQEAKQDGQIK